MIFFARFGYLVAVFFLVAAFIAGGIGTAYHLSRESTSVLLFLLWGPLCVVFGRKLDHQEKRSALFGIPMEYWGYGIISLGALDAYINWNNIASDWLAASAARAGAGWGQPSKTLLDPRATGGMMDAITGT